MTSEHGHRRQRENLADADEKRREFVTWPANVSRDTSYVRHSASMIPSGPRRALKTPMKRHIILCNGALTLLTMFTWASIIGWTGGHVPLLFEVRGT